MENKGVGSLFFKRLVCYLCILAFTNFGVIFSVLGLPSPLRVALLVVLVAVVIYYNIKPDNDKLAPRRLRIMVGGRELLIAAGIISACQIAIYVYLFVFAKLDTSTTIMALTSIIGVIAIILMALNGLVRIFATSLNTGVLLRVAVFLFWWTPGANIALIVAVSKIVKAEYDTQVKRYFLNRDRRGQAVCGTRYPLLLVHGVFFRDWKHFNYWGRIPKELTDNGARIFYGNHNSSLPVEQTAHELKQRILDVLQETGAAKVHIIAHSKGGLDSRYAISQLGMGKYVASLTTINTPHRGTPLASALMDVTPDKFQHAIGRRYKALFRRLGDSDSDFLGSVKDLTPERCRELNQIMPDDRGVLYQSLGSKMGSSTSAIFPLNLGHAIIKGLGGDNDGLVCTDSMAWGNALPIVLPQGRAGISHADMVDLTRKDIRNFDVCELYVGLVSDLRERGL
ncbi:MAG: hypothetical protein LBE83_06220 [Propionibacteriaceae bacterium]|jgi:triacylglycerol lipase|nr:hypothetical protein [Propionibacteriaceae bacterium]